MTCRGQARETRRGTPATIGCRLSRAEYTPEARAFHRASSPRVRLPPEARGHDLADVQGAAGEQVGEFPPATGDGPATRRAGGGGGAFMREPGLPLVLLRGHPGPWPEVEAMQDPASAGVQVPPGPHPRAVVLGG
jgi:hypothetical protein